jgi:DNA-binding transcriptional MerR regulator
MANQPFTTQSVDIPDRMFFRIGDVADIVGVKAYVLRYWESEFPILAPEKSSTGQRLYRKGEVEMLLLIKHLLYKERYSIEGARNRIRELRKDGALEAFKRERLSGGSAHAAIQTKLTRALQLTHEIQALASRSLSEIFKF